MSETSIKWSPLLRRMIWLGKGIALRSASVNEVRKIVTLMLHYALGFFSPRGNTRDLTLRNLYCARGDSNRTLFPTHFPENSIQSSTKNNHDINSCFRRGTVRLRDPIPWWAASLRAYICTASATKMTPSLAESARPFLPLRECLFLRSMTNSHIGQITC